MPLILKVLHYRNSVPEQQMSATFGKEGGTIGRRPENDWALPDPERYISGRHATISCSDDRYSIIDTSTNGVFVNHAEQPLGNGNSAELNDGDVLTIGDYEISVSISPEPVEKAPEIAEPEVFEDPFAPSVLAEAEKVLEEPLAEEEFEKTKAVPFPPPGELPHEAVIEEPFSEPTPVLEVPTPETGPESDHVSELDEHFPPPQPIPEDWDLALEPPRAEPAISEEQAPPAAPPAAVPLKEEPEAAPAQPPLGPEGTPGGFAGTGPLPSPGIRPRPEARPTVASTTTTVEAPSEAVLAEDHKALITALSKGLGLRESAIGEESLTRLLEHMGHLMRQCTQGTMELLRARADMKGEFGMSQTSIQPGENNPLKFLINVDEALGHLIKPTPVKGYLPPLRAVEEAYDDVEAHLLAVVAGMQAALHSVLTRFNPEVLEQRLVKMMVVDKYIPLYKHAKTWELFTQLYAEIAAEAEDDFQNLFGKAFTKAYEVQIKRLQALKREHESDES